MIEFATELALAAGELVGGRFRSAGAEVSTKPDGSPVTAADREAEALMREMIGDRFPDHGIVGEEFGSENHDAEFVWSLDPIDGTISFVSGVPLFGTLVGLMERGKPIIGVVYQPILQELVVGDGVATKLNGETVRVRPCDDLASSTLLTTDPNLVDRHQDPDKFDVLRRQVGMTRTWGDCYGYVMLVSGRADVMLDPVMNPWDLIPLIPIVRGAGGVISDWHGGDPVTGTSIVAAGPELHPRIIDLLR